MCVWWGSEMYLEQSVQGKQLNTCIPSISMPVTNVRSLITAQKCNVLVMERGGEEEEGRRWLMKD